MFSLRLAASRPLPRALTRSVSDVVPVYRSQYAQPPPDESVDDRKEHKSMSSSETSAKASNRRRVPVRVDHGLYAFFRKKTGGDLTEEDSYEVVETPEQGKLVSGRAWEASELRLKSFRDLHTLWYVVAREQNLLSTQKEEARRMGVKSEDMRVSMDKVRSCRKTMGRIKAVLNERRLAYEGAMKLAEQQMAAATEAVVDETDVEVMNFQAAQQQEERQKARIYDAQRRNLANEIAHPPNAPELTSIS